MFSLVKIYTFWMWGVVAVFAVLLTRGFSVGRGDLGGLNFRFSRLAVFVTAIAFMVSRERVTGGGFAFVVLLCLRCAAFRSNDLLAFFLFFEAVLLPLFFLIVVAGGQIRRLFAAWYRFVLTLAGAVGFSLALFLLYRISGTFSLLVGGVLVTFSSNGLSFGVLWMLRLLAFLVKVPVRPFHGWLPEAHVEAPTRVSVVLARVVLKLGSFGRLKFNVLRCPAEVVFLGPWVAVLAAASAVLAAVRAFYQADLKRVIAYSSISHRSVRVVARRVYNTVSLVGALLARFSHRFISAGLFILVGVLYSRYHTRILANFGGLATVMPIFSGRFFLFLAANFSFPGTAGFLAEVLRLVGVASVSPVLGGVLLVAGAGIRCYTLLIFCRVTFGALSTGRLGGVIDLNRLEFLILGVLLFWVFKYGLRPQSVLDFFESQLLELQYAAVGGCVVTGSSVPIRDVVRDVRRFAGFVFASILVVRTRGLLVVTVWVGWVQVRQVLGSLFGKRVQEQERGSDGGAAFVNVYKHVRVGQKRRWRMVRERVVKRNWCWGVTVVGVGGFWAPGRGDDDDPGDLFWDLYVLLRRFIEWCAERSSESSSLTALFYFGGVWLVISAIFFWQYLRWTDVAAFLEGKERVRAYARDLKRIWLKVDETLEMSIGGGLSVLEQYNSLLVAQTELERLLATIKTAFREGKITRGRFDQIGPIVELFKCVLDTELQKAARGLLEVGTPAVFREANMLGGVWEVLVDLVGFIGSSLHIIWVGVAVVLLGWRLCSKSFSVAAVNKKYAWSIVWAVVLVEQLRECGVDTMGSVALVFLVVWLCLVVLWLFSVTRGLTLWRFIKEVFVPSVFKYLAENLIFTEPGWACRDRSAPGELSGVGGSSSEFLLATFTICFSFLAVSLVVWYYRSAAAEFLYDYPPWTFFFSFFFPVDGADSGVELLCSRSGSGAGRFVAHGAGRWLFDPNAPRSPFDQPDRGAPGERFVSWDGKLTLTNREQREQFYSKTNQKRLMKAVTRTKPIFLSPSLQLMLPTTLENELLLYLSWIEHCEYGEEMEKRNVGGLASSVPTELAPKSFQKGELDDFINGFYRQFCRPEVRRVTKICGVSFGFSVIQVTGQCRVSKVVWQKLLKLKRERAEPFDTFVCRPFNYGLAGERKQLVQRLKETGSFLKLAVEITCPKSKRFNSCEWRIFILESLVRVLRTPVVVASVEETSSAAGGVDQIVLSVVAEVGLVGTGSVWTDPRVVRSFLSKCVARWESTNWVTIPFYQILNCTAAVHVKDGFFKFNLVGGECAHVFEPNFFARAVLEVDLGGSRNSSLGWWFYWADKL